MVFVVQCARGDVRVAIQVTGILGRSPRKLSSVLQCSRFPENHSGPDHQSGWNNRICGFIATSFIITSTFSPSPAFGATNQVVTAQLFENSCAGCHAKGGNIVKRDATLFESDLRKYGLDDPEQLYSIIYSGKGSMPGFGEECQPKGKCTFGKRLTDNEIQDLTKFVLDQAASGWK